MSMARDMDRVADRIEALNWRDEMRARGITDEQIHRMVDDYLVRAEDAITEARRLLPTLETKDGADEIWGQFQIAQAMLRRIAPDVRAAYDRHHYRALSLSRDGRDLLWEHPDHVTRPNTKNTLPRPAGGTLQS